MRTINVIDMYHGNSVKDVDFVALKKSGIFAIIHKASQGTSYADTMYSERRKAAQGAGLLWGAYHFINSTDAEKQAEFFLKCSGITDANSDPILLACDYEKSPSPASLQQCMKFMSVVDQVSPSTVQCVLYSGDLIRETLRPHVGGHQDIDMHGAQLFFSQHRLWLAEYGPKENIPWPWNESIPKSSDQSTPLPPPGVWLWQFTENGRVNPLTGATDGNYFDGDFAGLSARWLS